MSALKTVEFWIAAIGLLVALGFINVPEDQIGPMADRIVESVAVVFAAFATIKRLFGGDPKPDPE